MLRPLSVGEILDASFKVYGRNFMTMAKAIIVVAIPFSLLSAVIRASIPVTSTGSSTFPGLSTNTGATNSTSTAVANLLAAVVTVVSAAVSTAIIYRVVGDAYLGQPPSWRVALRSGLRKANSVLWLIFLISVTYVVAIVVPVFFIALAAQVSTGLAVLLGFAIGIPLICALVWFFVGAQLAVPSLMLEDYRGSKALRRGLALSRHLWWRCFGCLLLVGLIVGILSDIVGGFALVFLLSLAHSDVSRAAVYFASSVVTTVLFSPITASALVVLSIDLRVRKEGYDIQLLASQLGSQPGSSPLSFFPRPPVMWGGPPSPWATPGPPGWAQPGPQGWGPPGPQGWAQPGPQGWGQPTAPGWGPPQGSPGWAPHPTHAPWDAGNPQAPIPPYPGPATSSPPTGQPQGYPPAPLLPPPPPRPVTAPQSWVPQGQPEPAAPPPLFEGSPPAPPTIQEDSTRTEDTPGSD